MKNSRINERYERQLVSAFFRLRPKIVETKMDNGANSISYIWPEILKNPSIHYRRLATNPALRPGADTVVEVTVWCIKDLAVNPPTINDQGLFEKLAQTEGMEKLATDSAQGLVDRWTQ